MRFTLTTKGIVFCLTIVSFLYIGILLYETYRSALPGDGERMEKNEEEKGEDEQKTGEEI